MTGDFSHGAIEKPASEPTTFEETLLYYLYHIARAQYEQTEQMQHQTRMLEWIGDQYQPPPDTVRIHEDRATGPY